MLETSVIVSMYNGHKYILHQLESLMKQSKSPSEVLIFDDCSTDNSVQIVNNFIKNNHLKNWYLYVNKHNKGWRINFIDGIKKARGKFIFTCDQDDIWDKNKIKIQYNIISKDKSISVLASDYYTFNDEFNFPNTIDYSKKITKETWSNKFINVKRPGCTYCFSKNFFESILPYWKPYYEHDAFIWRMALLDNCLAVSNDKLIAWRIYKNSTLSRERLKRSLSKRKHEIFIEQEMLDSMVNYLGENSLSYEQKFSIDNYKKFLYERENFLETRTVRSFISLLCDFKFFSYKKQFIRDILTVIENRRENR